MEMHSLICEGNCPNASNSGSTRVNRDEQIGEAADFASAVCREEAGNSVWSLLSMYESIRRIQLWLLSAGQPMPVSHLMMVSCVTLFSFVVLVRRVTAPLRL
ncbi:MAG: hypothetical protein R3B96_16680 [Pirellulaceae bacterium]